MWPRISYSLISYIAISTQLKGVLISWCPRDEEFMWGALFGWASLTQAQPGSPCHVGFMLEQRYKKLPSSPHWLCCPATLCGLFYAVNFPHHCLLIYCSFAGSLSGKKTSRESLPSVIKCDCSTSLSHMPLVQLTPPGKRLPVRWIKDATWK